ncbi:MAG TPA: hypothetical protein VII93_12565 [Anaerolineales bacterium]
MYKLDAEEKATPVMIYTRNTLIHGEVVTRESIRVSVWLRMEGAPEYMHLLKPQVLNLSGSATKMLTYSELYIPTSEIIGFHLTPPAHDPLDYDESEMNRRMQPVSILVGNFVFNGAIRVSTQVDLGTSIISGRAVWMSIYNAKISSSYLPQMGEVQVPMLLVRPSKVNFALSE